MAQPPPYSPARSGIIEHSGGVIWRSDAYGNWHDIGSSMYGGGGSSMYGGGGSSMYGGGGSSGKKGGTSDVDRQKAEAEKKAKEEAKRKAEEERKQLIEAEKKAQKEAFEKEAEKRQETVMAGIKGRWVKLQGETRTYTKEPTFTEMAYTPVRPPPQRNVFNDIVGSGEKIYGSLETVVTGTRSTKIEKSPFGTTTVTTEQRPFSLTEDLPRADITKVRYTPEISIAGEFEDGYSGYKIIPSKTEILAEPKVKTGSVGWFETKLKKSAEVKEIYAKQTGVFGEFVGSTVSVLPESALYIGKGVSQYPVETIIGVPVGVGLYYANVPQRILGGESVKVLGEQVGTIGVGKAFGKIREPTKFKGEPKIPKNPEFEIKDIGFFLGEEKKPTTQGTILSEISVKRPPKRTLTTDFPFIKKKPQEPITLAGITNVATVSKEVPPIISGGQPTTTFTGLGKTRVLRLSGEPVGETVNIIGGETKITSESVFLGMPSKTFYTRAKTIGFNIGKKTTVSLGKITGKAFSFGETGKKPPASKFYAILSKSKRASVYKTGNRILNKYGVSLGKSTGRALFELVGETKKKPTSILGKGKPKKTVLEAMLPDTARSKSDIVAIPDFIPERALRQPVPKATGIYPAIQEFANIQTAQILSSQPSKPLSLSAPKILSLQAQRQPARQGTIQKQMLRLSQKQTTKQPQTFAQITSIAQITTPKTMPKVLSGTLAIQRQAQRQEQQQITTPILKTTTTQIQTPNITTKPPALLTVPIITTRSQTPGIPTDYFTSLPRKRKKKRKKESGLIPLADWFSLTQTEASIMGKGYHRFPTPKVKQEFYTKMIRGGGQYFAPARPRKRGYGINRKKRYRIF